MIAYKTWRDLWILAVIYYVVLQALIIPPILLWEELYAELMRSGLIRNVVGTFMPKFVEGITKTGEEGAFKNFMAVQVFFRGVNICGVAAAVLLGTGIIAREREIQTLEFLMARPVSRSWILWSKYWVCCVLLVVPIFVASWSVQYISTFVDHDISLHSLTLGSVHSSMFVLACFTLTCIFSVLCRTQLFAAASIGTFIVIQVAIYFVQTIRKFSVFQLSDFEVYGPIMTENTNYSQVFRDYTVWCLAGCVVFYIIADWRFRRTEL